MFSKKAAQQAQPLDLLPHAASAGRSLERNRSTPQHTNNRSGTTTCCSSSDASTPDAIGQLHVVDGTPNSRAEEILRSEKEGQETEAEREDRENEVQWDGDEDPENPWNWPRRQRIGIILMMSLLTVNVTFASSAPSPATGVIAEKFSLNATVATFITTSCFLGGYCLGPVLWASFSEMFGRRVVFIWSFGAYTLFIIGQPLAPNAVTFGITRLLSGLCASAPLTNAGGVIVDITDPYLRGYALSFFSAAVFMGPVLGPLVGSFVTQEAHWEWIFWVMVIFAFVCWLLVVFGLPETYPPILLMWKARKLRSEGDTEVWAELERLDWSATAVAKRTLFRPFEILFKEPILQLITVYLSVVYGLLYGLFESVPIVFSELRGFNLGETSLTFIAVAIGTTMGAAYSMWCQREYKTLQKVWSNVVPPEERLFSAFVGAPALVLGILWFGISGAYPEVHWIVPAIGLCLIGVVFTSIFIGLLSYVGDSLLSSSASALASNTMIRSALGAAFPLFTPSLWDPKGSIGPQNAALILGAVALVLAPSPFLFYRYGPQIRKRSRFAPCLDFQIREQLERDGILEPGSFFRHDRESRTGIKAWLQRQENIKQGKTLEKPLEGPRQEA